MQARMYAADANLAAGPVRDFSQIIRRLPRAPILPPSVSTPAAALALARPSVSFPRAVRRALPLRLLQLLSVLRATHAQLVAAAKEQGVAPPPDLTATMLQELVKDALPQLFCTSTLFHVAEPARPTQAESRQPSTPSRVH
jgi:hypothetical protein